MLPSPPMLAPLSPPPLNLEPSPSYSPISSPSTSPKPPPSPPLIPVMSKSRERERKLQELKEQVRHLELQRDMDDEPLPDRARARSPATTSPPASTVMVATATATTTTTSDVPDPGGLSADNIALRSTLRLLMLQRDRAKRDIHSLEALREAALKEPLQFVEFIQSQKTRGRNNSASSDKDKKPNIFAGKELPKPQEVYKCPSIEWSQYKILGAPLESLHEKHLRRQSPSRPSGQVAGPSGVPPSMQTGGIIGMPEYGNEDVMQGRLRMFDGLVQRGGVVGR